MAFAQMLEGGRTPLAGGVEGIPGIAVEPDVPAAAHQYGVAGADAAGRPGAARIVSDLSDAVGDAIAVQQHHGIVAVEIQLRRELGGSAAQPRLGLVID